MWEFLNLPMPPSDNRLTVSFIRRGKMMRASTPEAKVYKASMEAWALENRLLLMAARRALKPHQMLSVYFKFEFPRHDLWTLKNTPKRLDCANRIKASADALSRALEIDDAHFFRVSAVKCLGAMRSVSAYIEVYAPIGERDPSNRFSPETSD